MVTHCYRKCFKLPEELRFNNLNSEVLQGNIATLLEDELHLSYYIINIALGRYPDRPINKILANFPELLSKKKSP